MRTIIFAAAAVHYVVAFLGGLRALAVKFVPSF
jgi:hypothetical protein